MRLLLLASLLFAASAARVQAQHRTQWGVAVFRFEASSPQIQVSADSARAHVVGVLRGAGLRLVNRPPYTARDSMIPVRFAVVGTLTVRGDSIHLDAKLINVETAATLRQVSVTGPDQGANALGDLVGHIVAPDIRAAGR